MARPTKDIVKLPTTIRGANVDDAMRDEVRRRLARKIAALAPHVARLSVSLRDDDASDGGITTVCRVTATLNDLPTIIEEGRDADPALAVRHAADAIGRTLHRTVRSGPHAASARTTRRTRAASPGAITMRDDAGSLIDGRVGQGAANLERALQRPEKRRRDAFVDTSLPGVSASDRKAGYGATAARNTKRNTSGMQAALEDSRTTASRKSTRRSSNRTKAATAIQRSVQLATHAPASAATRAKVRQPRAGG